MIKTIPRNATRKLAELRKTHTDAFAYTLDNYFCGQPVKDVDWVWKELTTNAFAKCRYDSTTDVVTVRLHSNKWYELRRLAVDTTPHYVDVETCGDQAEVRLPFQVRVF